MNEPKATRYQRLRRRAHAADAASGVVLLALLAATPAGRWAAAAIHSLTGGLSPALQLPVATAAFVIGLVLAWEIVALPAVLYLGLRVDRHFKGAEQSVEGVLAAQAQATFVALPAALLAAAVLLLSIRIAGPWWWAMAGALLASALVGATRALPDLLVRLGQVRPVARRTLLAGLREVARRSNVPLSDILEWQLADGARTTALLSGLGRTRRVFIASDMLRDWSDDEIVVVAAHELGHHVHHDLWRTLALDAGLLCVGLWTADRALDWLGAGLAVSGGLVELASLPLVALVTSAVWLLATPLRHAQSRSHERRADLFALELTGEADAFGAAIRRLSAQHLAEDRPSPLTRWLFHRHPTVAERLALAAAFRLRTSTSAVERLAPSQAARRA